MEFFKKHQDACIEVFAFLFVSIISTISGFIHPTPCAFKEQYGIPCPTCGMTHAVFSLLHFNFVEAFEYNPGIFALIIAVPLHLFSGKYFKYVRWFDYAFIVGVTGLFWLYRYYNGFPEILFTY